MIDNCSKVIVVNSKRIRDCLIIVNRDVVETILITIQKIYIVDCHPKRILVSCNSIKGKTKVSKNIINLVEGY